MPKNIAELKDRLAIALELRNMKPIELSKITGLSKSAISQYMSGYAKPKDDRVYLISKALNISEAWLLGFDVPMERGAIKIDPYKDNSGYGRFHRYYSSLNEKGQEEAIKRVQELLFIPAYTKENPNLDAAHSVEGATQEDKDHDDNIMDNF